MRLVGTIVKPQGVIGELKIYPADKNLDIYKQTENKELVKLKLPEIKQARIQANEQSPSSFIFRAYFLPKQKINHEEPVIINSRTPPIKKSKSFIT